TRFDCYRRGHALEVRSDQSEAGFALAYGGLALALKHTINNGELPARRRLGRPDTIAAAKKANVFDNVACLVNRCLRCSKVKIDVSQKAVLGIARANGHRSGIAVLELNVHVGKRRVERPGVRVRDGCIGGCGVPLAVSSETRPTTGEEKD